MPKNVRKYVICIFVLKKAIEKKKKNVFKDFFLIQKKQVRGFVHRPEAATVVPWISNQNLRTHFNNRRLLIFLYVFETYFCIYKLLLCLYFIYKTQGSLSFSVLHLHAFGTPTGF